MSLPVVSFDPTQTIVPRKSLAVFIPTNGTAQVETATIVGTIGTAGTATTTVTASGLSGSPVAVVTSLALNDTPTQSAAKIRASLNGNVNIAATFIVGGSGPDITLTRILAAANDATTNIAYTNTTSAGLTPGATSVDTVVGLPALTPVNLIGKVSSYDSKFTSVMRKVPGAIDGLLRADRNVAIEQEESVTMEIEDVKSVFLGIFGGLNGGFVQGSVQLFIVDPDDAIGKVSIKSNYFKCSVELDGGLSFKAGDVVLGKVKFVALEKVTLTPNATA